MSPTDLPPSVADHPRERTQRCSRDVLEYFEERATDTATVEELLNYVLDERRSNAETAEADVATHLHHITLPRLADAGIIEYDGRSNTARFRGE